MFSCFIKFCVHLFFFFQAEDGIRDGHVTGVQTCALPIYFGRSLSKDNALYITISQSCEGWIARFFGARRSAAIREIGRASCRERGENWGGGGQLRKKRKGRIVTRDEWKQRESGVCRRTRA